MYFPQSQGGSGRVGHAWDAADGRRSSLTFCPHPKDPTCRVYLVCALSVPGPLFTREARCPQVTMAPRALGTLRPRQACKGPTSSPISQKQKPRLRGVLGSYAGAELGPCLFRLHWSSLPPRPGPLQLGPTVSTSEPQPQLPCPFGRAGSRPLLLLSLPFSRN